MRLVMPVKAFNNAKARLSPVFSPRERARFSCLMLEDILDTVCTSPGVESITVVSSDPGVRAAASRERVRIVLTEGAQGFSEDAMRGLTSLGPDTGPVAVLPADVPQLRQSDITCMMEGHEGGITLCPAIIDGGTNGLVFDPPLPIPLMFGRDSLRKHREEAERRGVRSRILRVPGLERDIDRPADLHWLQSQPRGGRAWSFARRARRSVSERIVD